MSPFSFFRIFILLLFSLPFSLEAQTPDVVVLCSGNSQIVSNAPTGEVYDPGGPFGNYFDYSNCSLLIDPGCTGPITLDLTEFYSESGYDYLSIYDGENSNGQWLGSWTGFQNPATLTAHTGKVFLFWHTDGSATYPGFRLAWTSTLIPPVAPAAGFIASSANPAFLEYVTFTDTSTNLPYTWEWNFGDSTSSNAQNPVHQYTASGTYTVQLIVTNCHDLKDTVEQEITVQLPPLASVTPVILSFTGACGGTAQTDFTISNTGNGDLVYTLQNTGSLGGSFSPGQGNIHTDTSATITFTVNTMGYYPGTYQGTALVYTNDTTQSTIEIPWTVEVTSQPAFATYPELLDFGASSQFVTNGQYIQVLNTGCSPLEIISVVPDTNLFTVDNTPFTVSPFSAYGIVVNCTPQDTGLITGNLVFETNAGTFNFPMQIFSIGSAQVTVVPEAVEATLSCNDSTTVQLQIVNTGLGELYLNVAPNTPSRNVLLLTALAYDYQPGYNISNWIYQSYPNVSVYSLDNYLSQEQLEAAFAQADMVIIPALGGYGTYTAEQLKTELTKFTKRGGAVLVTGTPNYGLLQELGLLTVGPNYGDYYGYSFSTLDPTHPIVQNIDFQNNITYESIFGLTISDTDYSRLINIDGYDILGYRTIGKGKVIYLGHFCYYDYYTEILLIQNAFKWVTANNWLSYNEAQILVPAGDTAVVEVTLKSEGLLAGDYNAAISYSTNDPVHPYGTIPVTMHIAGQPDAALLTSSLHFGVMQQFTSRTLTTELENNGCDTLFINNVSFSNNEFSIMTTPGFVLPRASQQIAVVFTPQHAGNYQDSMSLQTNDGNFTVTLQALVAGAPVVTVNPGEILLNINCEQTLQQQINIANSGIAGYNFSTEHPGNYKVAVLQYGTYYSRWANLVDALATVAPGIPYINLNDPNGFADSLAKADILIIPSIELDDPSTFTAFYAPLQAFINKGGVVMIAGIYQTSPLVQMGLLNGGNGFMDFGTSELNKVIPTHALADGLEGINVDNAYHYGAHFSPSEGYTTILQVLQSGQTAYDYLSYKMVGDGIVVWMGYPFDNGETVIGNTILSNFLTWAYQPFAPGTSLTGMTAGIILPNGAQNLLTEFTGNNLPFGSYPGQIRLYGNDPVNNPFIIPVTVNAGKKPCADFNIEKNLCSGTVHFTDKTINPTTSWYWMFGDGTEIFEQNPEHTYTQAGEYTVTFVGCNDGGCDTTHQTVQITFQTSPVSACQPVTVYPTSSAGILRVQLGTIDHTSGNSYEDSGYQDFSCLYGTVLNVDQQHEITVTTTHQSNEYVVIWIDFDNNGVFSANEKVLNDLAIESHQGYITIPVNAVKNTPIRMRIATSQSAIPSSCGDIYYGQAEDYFVILEKTVGAVEPQQMLQAQIAPNPTIGNSWLSFSSDAVQTAQLTITNPTGQIVQSKMINIREGSQKVELTPQPAGVYMVRLQTGDKVFIAKWVCN